MKNGRRGSHSMPHPRMGGRRRGLAVVLAVIGVALSVPSVAQERKAFRVCADPNYLPFSSRDRSGFENRIAEILAAQLNLPVEYTWFPQRMGFIRNTLRAPDPEQGGYKCDVVMGVPHGYGPAMTTRPYYRSTYALVYVRGRNLDDVQAPADLLSMDTERRQKLRIGVTERSPGALWLAKHGMYEQIVPYVAQPGDPAVAPGQLEREDLLAGNIDAAILWGPIAGYFANQSPEKEVVVSPMRPEPGVRFHFPMSLAVRFGEGAWKRQLSLLLERKAHEIETVLREFNVPLVSEQGVILGAAE